MRLYTLSLLSGGLLLMLAGCGKAPEASSGPPPRQKVVLPKMSVDEIARTAFGTAYRAASVEGAAALYSYAPKKGSTPTGTYNKIFLMGAGVIPVTFRDEPGVQTIRLTAVDVDTPARRLIVWSVTRAAAKKIPWEHLPPVHALTGQVKVEYRDAAFAQSLH